MRKGKMIAQGAHASLGALLKLFYKKRSEILNATYREVEEGTFITEYRVSFADKSINVLREFQ